MDLASSAPRPSFAGFRLSGLIAATFTPMHRDGRIDEERIEPMVEFVLRQGAEGLYVLGSTGEGPSLTTAERRRVATRFIQANQRRVPLVVQVGHASVRESCELAAHAEENGADAFSATPPSYFRPENLDVLVACVAEIAAAAPSLPFYYYHLPDITQVRFDMTAFLAKAAPIIPNLRGIKFSALQIFEMQACVEWENGRFDIVFGSDEMLLSGLVGGARGAVGSTYNFAAPLFRRVIAAFEQGDLATATAEQSRAASMIERILRPIGRGGLKATMAVLGCNCGPNRLPIVTATARDRQLIEAGLGELGLLDLLRPGQETLVPAAAK